MSYLRDSRAWDKYITDTHILCGTVRSALSRMGQVHHRHTHPMWYSPQRTLTHGTSTSQTHTSHVVQSATNSHAWDKYITDTHIPCGTVRSRLSRIGQVHHRHTHPMWYSPQRTLTHGTSTSQTYSLCGNMYIYNIKCSSSLTNTILKLCTSRLFSTAHPPDPSHHQKYHL